MAWDPCVSCNSSFRGKASVSYVTWFDGESKFNYRLRQCPRCSADFRNPVVEAADFRTGDADWERSDLVVAAADARRRSNPPRGLAALS